MRRITFAPKCLRSFHPLLVLFDLLLFNQRNEVSSFSITSRTREFRSVGFGSAFHPSARALAATSKATRGKSEGNEGGGSSSNNQRRRTGRPRSRVVDPDGPTPDATALEIEELESEPLLEDVTRSEDLPRPISHQPWRRGDTAGCDAPISAPWRAQAEDIIEKAVRLAGGKVLDVTWYLTQLVVTIDDEMLPPTDLLKGSGPPIDIIEKSNPMYYDPNDPDPEEIVGGVDDEVVTELSTAEERRDEAQRRKMMYAAKDEDDPDDETHIPDQDGADPPVPLYVNELTRDQVALQQQEDALAAHEQEEKPVELETIRIDSSAISAIARSILDALEPHEDELEILSRHELILTSPGADDVLETQRQFDAFRGFDVIVETQDPFESNRVLKGKLVDRNSMDLIINKKGRKVTIPLNFVKCVRLPPAKKEAGVPRDAPSESAHAP